jgi:hypothetical protein
LCRDTSQNLKSLTSLLVKCEYSTFPSRIFQFSLTITNNLFKECLCISLDSLLRGSSTWICLIDSGQISTVSPSDAPYLCLPTAQSFTTFRRNCSYLRLFVGGEGLTDPKGIVDGTIYMPEQDFFGHLVWIMKCQCFLTCHSIIPSMQAQKSVVIKISGNEKVWL